MSIKQIVAGLIVVACLILAARGELVNTRWLLVVRQDGCGIPVMVEVAVSRDDLARGLMGRRSLPEDEGMLFIFPDDQVLSFWMKNTHIPLTIAYLDSAGYILELHDAEPLDETPIVSGQPCRYALEMNRGWFARHGIEVGAQVVL